MSTNFKHKQNTINLYIVKNKSFEENCNIENIINTIKNIRKNIANKISKLEKVNPITDDIERKIAILILQEQYLAILQNKNHNELIQIFSNESEKDCLSNKILHWYNSDN